MTEKTPKEKESSRKMPTPGDVAKRLGKVAGKSAERDSLSIVDEVLAAEDEASKSVPANDEKLVDTIDEGEKADEELKPSKPTNTRSTDEVLADDAADRERPLDERIAELEGKLDDLRDELSDLGKKRGSTRAFGKTGGGRKVVDAETGVEMRRTYDVVHGEYIATLHKLATLKLKADKELQDLWSGEDIDDKRKSELRKLALQKGMKFIDDDQTKLRTMTTEKLEGTLFGRFCKKLNSGGRIRRLAKHLAFGIATAGVGVGVGLITGGVGLGAAVGLGTTIGLRGLRGFTSAEARSGRNLAEHEHGQLMRKFEDLAGGIEEVMEASAKAVADMYNGAVEMRAKSVKRALGMATLFATAGGAIGQILQHTGALDRLANRVTGGRFTGAYGHETQPGGSKDVPERGLNDLQPTEEKHIPTPEEIVNKEFGYNANENPFYQNKLSTHGMGPALDNDPRLLGKPGLHDLTENRWKNSPHQFASIVHAMGLDNLPDDMQSANALAEKFKVNPRLYADYHERVMAILQDPSTKIETGVPIKNPYESEWGVDPDFERTGVRHPGSDFQLAWDNYVDPAGDNGTKTVITYKDPNPPHALKTLELREQCGGQRIRELPPPQPKPVYQQPVYKAPVREVTTYTPPREVTPPPAAPPQETPPPPPNIPPVAPPVPPIPPVHPPVPDKPPSNPLNDIIPNIFPPSPVGPGAPNIPTRPPSVYNPPSGGNGGDLAPGARPPRIRPNVGPANPGLNPSGGGRNRGLI